MKKRFKLTPAVYLMLQKDNSLLLLRRYNTGYHDGDYSLIAGHLDGNESLTRAMVREAKEEAGISINPNHLSLVHTMHLHSETDGASDERMTFYFITHHYDGEPYNAEPNKCDAMIWIPSTELPNNIIPHVRYALEHIKSNIYYSEFGWDNRL